MFLSQVPKYWEEHLGYERIYKVLKKLEAIASVEGIEPHRFRHEFGTSITAKVLIRSIVRN